MRFLVAVFLLPILLSAAPTREQAASATPASGSGSGTRTCHIDDTSDLPGTALLSADDFRGAETSFRALLVKDPASTDAALGLVRALLGEDRIADARAVAQSMLNANPKGAVAEVAFSEVDYRDGNPDASLTHARAALQDDPCEGRADSALASILSLNGYYGKEAGLLEQAHRLRPRDELLRRYWIGSLSRKRRQEEIARYLEEAHHLSEESTQSYSNSLTYLKAHRPGDCRITSKSQTTELAFQPIYGDHTHPVAFGLDVSFNNLRRRMQIDTGASGIVLSPGAARALKLQPEFHVKTGGIGDEGKIDSYLAHVDKIQIGDIELSNCMVEVMGKARLDVDGLIGSDVFSRWLVTLNYGDAKARLEPLPLRPGDTSASASGTSDDAASTPNDDAGPQDRYIAPEMKNWGRMLRIGHSILLPASFKADSPLHYLIMDTGASRSVLSSSMASEAGKLHSSPMQFYGLSGKVNKVFEIDSTPLIVANLRLSPETYYAYDLTGLSHSMEFETSGLLGLPTLQRLTIHIDYRDNLIKFDYDPKHDVQRF